jgi:hypothetical protein
VNIRQRLLLATEVASTRLSKPDCVTALLRCSARRNRRFDREWRPRPSLRAGIPTFDVGTKALVEWTPEKGLPRYVESGTLSPA